MWKNVFGAENVIVWDWREYQKNSDGVVLDLFQRLGLSLYSIKKTMISSIVYNQTGGERKLSSATRILVEKYYNDAIQ